MVRLKAKCGAMVNTGLLTVKYGKWKTSCVCLWPCYPRSSATVNLQNQGEPANQRSKVKSPPPQKEQNILKFIFQEEIIPKTVEKAFVIVRIGSIH